MLEITVPAMELYDEKTNEFFYTHETPLKLEHSLISISKWEAKWHIPFMSKTEKTREQVLDYIRCMTLTQNVDPKIYYSLTQENIDAVEAYIKDPMTATTIKKDPNAKKSNEIVTSEVIYYWMTELNIPPEYAKWHLSRLLMLIEVASIKKQPPKKMSKRDIMKQNAQLNAARRAKYNSKG